MVFSYSRQTNAEAIHQSLPSNAAIAGNFKLDPKQIFQFIDSVLPFEACLYHQVLPLNLEENCLTLGMVNQEDTDAIDYVEQILSYLNYSLKFQAIATETHQAILSAYLHYNSVTRKTKRWHQLRSTTQQSAIAADSVANTDQPVASKIVEANQNERPTLILVEPEELNHQKAAQINSPTAATSTLKNSSATQPDTEATQALPSLEVQAAHLSSSAETLATLPPRKLLQELLGRVLTAGIGRLYFERKSPQHGRIICSQNGNYQCVLARVPIQVFQSLIDELKQLTHLALTPVQAPQQAEIERLYQQERILLRLRVMPVKQGGEEATLQVLRGQALHSYQKQQMARLSQDTLAIAQQLQGKLHQLQKRANQGCGQSESLSALNQLLESVDTHLEKLKQLQD